VCAAFAFRVAARTPGPGSKIDGDKNSVPRLVALPPAGGIAGIAHSFPETIMYKLLCIMMTAILAIVLLLWLIGVVTAHTLGGLIHLLLLLALIILLIDILDRRKVL